MPRFIVRNLQGMSPGIADLEIPIVNATFADGIELTKQGEIR